MKDKSLEYESASSNGEASNKTLDLSELNGLIGFLIRFVQLNLFQAFFERFQLSGLSPGEYSTLVAAQANPGANQGEIAAALMIKRSNMTKLVNGLESRKLISRSVTKEDKRAVKLNVTPKGRQLIDAIASDIVEHDHATVSALSVHERHMLLGLLGKIADQYRGVQS
ncbi:MarR family winged helix-turn-helix transcriptional regulator [Tardiphaga sp.]|jgi:DNA-binding MarR family transcriptional regulator|uniref:MarR family winged helix-turn-helix transcriptional regulator n=1 Tax=Tardiphaga sp. TaxID=1926292 RepID=UPI0037DA0B5F